jgi:hypothetical protein
LTWVIFWVVLLLIFIKVSPLNQPLLSIAAYGLAGMLVLTFVFVFFTAHEAYAGMMWLVSQNAQKGKNNLLPFFLISVMFLANALLIYFENTKQLTASSYIVSPIFVFIVNAILGLWSIRKYLDQTQNFSFNAVGVWVYVGFAIVASSTVAFIYLSGNDPLQELFEDAVSICTLVMSICFFVYVIMNFFQLLGQGLQVHKVLFKAPYSKLVYTRTVGLFAVVFLFSMKGMFSYYQFQAGINNVLGDYHIAENDLKMAETYYKSGANFDRYNHKANLSLASMAAQVGDKVSAGFFYNQSIQKIPNAFAYAGLSSCLEQENLFFESIFAIQNGIQAFPENHKLYTNLAYLQSKAKQTDSLYLNLTHAAKLCQNCGSESSNLMAFWIENGRKEKLEEMTKNLSDKGTETGMANKLALAKIMNTKGVFSMPKLRADSGLNVSQVALLANAASNSLIEKIPGVTANGIEKLIQKSDNQAFSGPLSLALAQQLYLRENKIEGLKAWTRLAEGESKEKPMLQQNLGLMYIKEGLLNRGLIHLETSGDLASVELIKKQNLAENIEKSLQAQAQKIGADLSLKNYKETLNRAPFNPYLISMAADVLIKNKKETEAYNLVYYSTDFNPKHPEIWKAYFKSALAASQYEYAQDALIELQGKIPGSQLADYELQLKTKQTANLGF